MDKILFIDYYNFLHRACVKFEKLSVPDEEIFAFNFFRNLRPIIEKFSPNKCFFALEGHPKFRYDLYSDYKKNRIIKEASAKERKELVSTTSSIVLDILKFFPVTIVKSNDYEADDLIATLADNLKLEDLTIISNDSDYIQLLQKKYNKIQIYNPIKKDFYQNTSYHYIAWKALAGDKSDNIPSIVSKQKAEKLVANPREMLKFFENEENRANFNINKELIEFKIIPLDEIILLEGTNEFDKIKIEFEKLNFNSILQSWKKYTSTFKCLNI